MARDTWYRLDNVGKFYSSQAGSTAQTVFRFSATLADEVDAEVLQLAVDKTVDIFPNFNVCLRSGMFWHYLEQSAEPPTVHPETLPICFGLHVDTKSILFRVSYYRERVNLEVSHIVSDGRGTMSFFKALLYTYIQERYGISGVPLEYDGSDRQKAENSFDKYYERGKAASDQSGQEGATSPKRKVYRLTGWRDEADPTYLEYHLPTQEVLDLSHSYGVSVTSLIIAVLISAIRSEMPRRERQREIRIGIPVDLRQVFESTTTKNFFGLASVSYMPGDNDDSIHVLASMVQEQIAVATTPERLKPRMNQMIAFEKNPLLRFAPLFVKDTALELADWLTMRKTTTTVSNLGQVEIDERLVPFIREINILSTSTGLTFTLCSLGDVLSIGISTVYSNLDVIKHMCRYFSAQGIEGHINISKTSEEVAADWREARIENSVKRLSGQIPAQTEASVEPLKAVEGEGAGHEAVR